MNSILPRLALLLILVIGLANLPVTVHAGSSSDLTVDSIWLEDASQIGQPISQVSPGQSFNIIATIKNIGQETASGYYLDVYYDSDYGRGGPDNIAPGEVQTWYVGPLTAQAGTHTTKWVVDPDNQIVELNETNNEKDYTFTIGAQTTTTTSTSSSTTILTTQTTQTSTTATSTSTSTTTTTSSTSTTSSPPTVSITLTANPSGSIVVDGATYTSQQTFTWIPGSSHTITADSPVPGGSGTEYVWVSWADGGDQSRTVTTPSSPTTYTANYQTQYQVTYSQTGCSLTVSMPATEWVNAGGSAVGVFPSTIISGDGKAQCLLQNASPPGPINAPTALTATYKTLYSPVVTVPADITVNATGPNGAVVTYTASASDLVDGPLAPTCTPSSGSTFALGSTTVSCSVTDKAGNTASASFKVTVVDRTPPKLQLPADITAPATSSKGAVVKFSASATDLVDGSVTVTCTPASGSTFPFGTTTVSCSAKDKAGNSASGSFKVTVPMVTVTLLASNGSGRSGAVVQYYSGSWKAFGTTGSDGTAKMGLTSGTYNFQISWAGATQQKSQNVGTNPNVVFQTTLVTVKLVSSTNVQLSGSAQYYAGGWKKFGGGTTTTTMELLPLTYTFQVSYAGASQQISQNTATNPNVIFRTVQVHSDSGKCTSYYAGGWKTFTQDMQLLPGTYTFRFSDKTRDTSYTLVVGVVKHIH